MPADLFTGRPVGSTGVYFLFQGSPVFVKEVPSRASYALVTDSAKVGFDYLVRAVLDDGTSGVYSVSAYNGSSSSASLNDANLLNIGDRLFRFVKNGDGTLSLFDAANTAGAGAFTYQKGDNRLTDGYYMNNTTPVFVLDSNGNCRVYRGVGTIPSMTASAMTIVRGEPILAEQSLYFADAVLVKGASYTGTLGSEVWYVNSPLSVVDADGSQSFTAAGAAATGYEVTTFNARKGVEIMPGTLYRFRIDMDGYVSEAIPAPSVKGFATSAENGLLLVGTISQVTAGANSVDIRAFSYNAMTQFMLVDGYQVTIGSESDVVSHTEEQIRIDAGRYYTDWTGYYTGAQPRAKYELEVLDADSDGVADIIYCYAEPRV
jgi:hypothetical protein